MFSPYMAGECELVREFIKRVKIQKEDASDNAATDKDAKQKPPFAYCVCTAGDTIALTIDNLNATILQNPSLQALGITEVKSSYSLIMPESYIGLPFMDVDTKENEIRKKEEAAQELVIISEEVFNRKEGVNRLVKVPSPGSSPRWWVDSSSMCSSPTSDSMWRRTAA